jgi:hypothetical protein
MVALGALLVHMSAVAVEYNPSEYVRQKTAGAFHRPRATYASDPSPIVTLRVNLIQLLNPR